MVKAPIAGTVKTRLMPFLSAPETAELAVCFVQDAVLKAQIVTKNIIIAYAPVTGREILEKLLPESLLWHEQNGADLGERMHHALEFASAQGFSPLLIIGTDSPTLPVHLLEFVPKMLQNKTACDVVIWETEDGGFCLIGMREPNAEIFRKVEWSSEKTFSQTFCNIERLDLKTGTLTTWYDVDLPADLRLLEKDLIKNPQVAPNTAKWFQKQAKLCRINDNI